MPELKEMLKEVVSRFKKANVQENESTRRMMEQAKAARKVSKELKEQKE